MAAIINFDFDGAQLRTVGLALDRIGHVYILESSDGASCKIGRSSNPTRRLAGLRTQANATGREWVSPIQADCFLLEKRIHAALDGVRSIGEWFSIGIDAAIAVVLPMIHESPSDADIEDAYRAAEMRADSLCQALKQVALSGGTHEFQHRSDESDHPHEDAIAFVFAAEDSAIENGFTCDEERFFSVFDNLPVNVAMLAGRYMDANNALLLAGVSRPEREQILKQYAMDWRLANCAALPSPAEKEAAHG